MYSESGLIGGATSPTAGIHRGRNQETEVGEAPLTAALGDPPVMFSFRASATLLAQKSQYLWEECFHQVS